MSLRSLCKLLAAFGVLAVMGFTALLAYHVFVSPLGGRFAKIIPTPVRVAHPQQPAADVAEMLDAPELLAQGRLAEARDKLNSLITTFPGSPSAPVARRILGEMNLDDILSSAHMEGKKTHVVKRGDSLMAIAGQNKTTVDCIMYLNSMLDAKRIQPGDELIVMPLEFRLLVEPRRNCLSLWDGERFIREYQILHVSASARTALKSTISSKAADLGGKHVQPQSKEFRAAEKVIQIAKSPVQIRGWNGTGPQPSGGILLRTEDMEEISLLTRVGNEVEVR